jgi:hypothetical protein
VLCLIVVPLPPGRNPFAGLIIITTTIIIINYGLCSSVVRVPGYRLKGPDSIP